MPPPGKKRLRIGEMLIEQGLITTHQLKDALKRQAQIGGQIGSILVEMGYITTDDLLNSLSQQLGIPSANLFKIDISPELLKLMPLEKMNTMKVLPINFDDTTITLAMANPRDMLSIRDIEFSLGKKVQPVVVPSAQLEAVMQNLMLHPGTGISGGSLEQEVRRAETRKAPTLITLLKYLAGSTATDMLLTAGVPPSIKLSNEIKRASMEPLTPADCERYARELLTDKDWEAFTNELDHDVAVTFPEIGRFRVNLYRQRNSISITLRHIKDILPSMEDLNLPAWVRDFVLMPQGLILISGPAGHGKSTTLAALVDIINSEKRCNIVTLEDPIEHLHKHKRSNVNQRDIGLDTKSFVVGLKHVFRQDPDVIVVGEMRDAESFSIALQAADTGHLVITTVHASTAASTIERAVNIFPADQQGLIRTRIADNLLFVLSQRLVPAKKGDGRVLAFEKLINGFNIKNFIREGKTHQIKAQLLSGSDDYSSLEASLARLYLSGAIKFEDGLVFVENKQFYKDLCKIT